MKGPFNNFVKAGRYWFIGALALLGIAGVVCATFIGPLTKEAEMLPDDTRLMIQLNLASKTFNAASGDKDSLSVNLVWGVAGLDRSEVGLWDPDNVGKLIWDDSFTIVPPENQQALLDTCADLRDNFELVKFNDVVCWIEDFD